MEQGNASSSIPSASSSSVGMISTEQLAKKQKVLGSVDWTHFDRETKEDHLMAQIEEVMGPVAMAEKKVKKFCLFDRYSEFMVIPVSVSAEEEATPEELDEKIIPIKGSIIDHRRSMSFVSVGSMVYCIGGLRLDEHAEWGFVSTNEVTMFDADQPEFKFLPCCNMIMPRIEPAVVSKGGKIYVFGGYRTADCPWAEFLDTNKPQSEQKWKALKEPVSRFWATAAIHYDSQTILIRSAHDINQGAIIYNVADESSSPVCKSDWLYLFKLFPSVTLSSDKTIYWLHGMDFNACEFDDKWEPKHSYTGFMPEVFPDFCSRFVDYKRGPVLGHVKDNLFVIFSLTYLNNTPTVDCAKVRVTKHIDESGMRSLKLVPVGHHSYQYLLPSLYGAVPIYN